MKSARLFQWHFFSLIINYWIIIVQVTIYIYHFTLITTFTFSYHIFIKRFALNVDRAGASNKFYADFTLIHYALFSIAILM